MNATTQTLLDYHREQLHASGLTDATIAAAGFYSVTDSGKMARLLNVKKLPKGLYPAALAIPFTDADGRNGYCRLRPDNPRIDAAKKKPIKYESPRNEPNQLYIPPGAVEHFGNTAQELAITEGEKKALAANQAGLPCLGLVGVFGWKEKGKETMLPALEHIDWKGRTVYIIVDSDGADKVDVREGMTRLGSLIKHCGGIAKLIILPPGSDGAKVGLDDYLVAHGFGELRKLLDAAEDVDDSGAEARPDSRCADPADEAKSFLETGMQDGVPLLRFWRDQFHFWANGRYVDIPNSEASARIVNHLNCKYSGVGTSIAADLLLQVKAQSHLSFGHNPPCWLGPGPADWHPLDLLACKNGILNLRSLELKAATPRFFTPNATDYDFNLNAARPDRWLAFLGQLWPDDPESISMLQEWMGYLLTPDTRQQKILTIIGPRRSGKGTLARVIRAIVGEGNCCGPTLAGLATNFGLQPLLGKSVAFISDARMSPKTDQAVVTERLLSISGEDAQTVDRKHLLAVTCKLLVRFTILSNELPRLTDSSGAFAGRMILLRLLGSFYGKENTGLTDHLLEEREGILLWAIEGWGRLQERGHFIAPESGNELAEQLEELASPVGAFVRQCCVVAPGRRVLVDGLYAAWVDWCKVNGRDNPGISQVFGRDLSAVVPQIRRTRPSDGDGGANPSV